MNLAEAQERLPGREGKGNEQKRENKTKQTKKTPKPIETVGVPTWVLSPGRGLSEGDVRAAACIQKEGLETPREGTEPSGRTHSEGRRGSTGLPRAREPGRAAGPPSGRQEGSAEADSDQGRAGLLRVPRECLRPQMGYRWPTASPLKR